MTRAFAILRAAFPWVALGLACALVLLLTRSCNRADGLAGELARSQEAARLTDAGQVVVVPVADVRPEVDRLTAENATLRAALASAKRAAPDARPVAVASAQTAPAPVSGPPTASTHPCLLAEGDALTLRVDEVVLRTRAGNRLLVGTVSAARGEAMLLRAPFSAPLTSAEVEAGPPSPGWGAGPVLLAGSDGWAAGVAVAAPALRVPWLGWSAEASLGAGLGPSGRVAGAVTLILRP